MLLIIMLLKDTRSLQNYFEYQKTILIFYYGCQMLSNKDLIFGDGHEGANMEYCVRCFACCLFHINHVKPGSGVF